MSIVVDSNIIAALVLPVSYSPQAIALVNSWRAADETLIAPMLFEYEIATIIHRTYVLGQFPESQIATIMDRLLDATVFTIAPTPDLHLSALHFAQRIGQSKAYDSQYLALAERENAPLWTADRRLSTAAQQVGLAWVRWIGEALNQ